MGCPSLPPEVIAAVIAKLDPDDRATLLALCLTSQDCWELAARALYANLSLNSDQFRLLLAGGRSMVDLPRPAPVVSRYWKDGPFRPQPPCPTHAFMGTLGERARRALGFVQQLRILEPLDVTCVHMMWDTAREVPFTPLFPRVHQLVLQDWPPGTPAPTLGRAGPIAFANAPPSDSGVVIFGTLDICATGGRGGVRQFTCYSAVSIRSLTVHGPTRDALWTLGTGWPNVSFKVFDQHSGLDAFILGISIVRLARRLQDWHPPLLPLDSDLDDRDMIIRGQHLVIEFYRRLYSTFTAPPGLVPLVIYSRARSRPDLEGLLLERLGDVGWDLDSPYVQFKVYEFGKEGDCPPCELCGEFLPSS